MSLDVQSLRSRFVLREFPIIFGISKIQGPVAPSLRASSAAVAKRSTRDFSSNLAVLSLIPFHMIVSLSRSGIFHQKSGFVFFVGFGLSLHGEGAVGAGEGTAVAPKLGGVGTSGIPGSIPAGGSPPPRADARAS
jgi:hypothetical protein